MVPRYPRICKTASFHPQRSEESRCSVVHARLPTPASPLRHSLRRQGPTANPSGVGQCPSPCYRVLANGDLRITVIPVKTGIHSSSLPHLLPSRPLPAPTPPSPEISARPINLASLTSPYKASRTTPEPLITSSRVTNGTSCTTLVAAMISSAGSPLKSKRVDANATARSIRHT